MRPSSRPVAALLLICTLPACAGGWSTRTVEPQESKRTVYAGEVRVDLVDGTRHYFRGLWVGPDSLGGWLTSPAVAEQAFALRDVLRVQSHSSERPGSDSARGGARGSGTHALVGMGVGAAMGAILGLIAVATCDEDKPSSGVMTECGAAKLGLIVLVPTGMVLGALIGAAVGNE
jgi:hypothetical protein